MARSAASSAQLASEGQQLERAGDYVSAARIYEQLVRSAPKSADALLRLGRIETTLARFKEARAHLGKAARLKPNDPNVHLQLALLYRAQGSLEEAKQCAQKALRLTPGRGQAVAVLAELHRMAGEYEQAYRILRERFDKGDRDPKLVAGLGRLAHRFGAQEEIQSALESAVETPGLPPNQKADLLFTLGAMRERDGDYNGAFEAYQRANENRPTSFRPEFFDRTVDEILSFWTPEFHQSLPRAPESSELPVFIIGMPRSGTSLLEQVLACHPEVHGAGERKAFGDMVESILHRTGFEADAIRKALPPHRVERFHKDYIRDLRKLDRSAARITDKMPYNFRHLPFIDLLLPGARIIRMRRDPRDVCLSCYAQDLSGNHPFKHDLHHLGRFHHSYERLMDHWQSVVEAPLLDVSYERLARDLEGETKRVLNFLGLEWSDACLRFHESTRIAATASNEQVRAPIYTSSIGRHHRFSARLAPLYEALELGSNDPNPCE